MRIWQRAFKLASTLLLSVGFAAAQTPQTTPTRQDQAPETGGIPVTRPVEGEPAPGTKPMEEEILVTGSRLRRKDLTTPAPVTVLTRQQLQESGRVTIGDFLQLLPEQGNAPNFQLNNGGSTYSADGSTRISLRSLGVTRTLVLVNGRRMVNAGLGASSAGDLNSRRRRNDRCAGGHGSHRRLGELSRGGRLLHPGRVLVTRPRLQQVRVYLRLQRP